MKSVGGFPEFSPAFDENKKHEICAVFSRKPVNVNLGALGAIGGHLRPKATNHMADR